MSFSPPFFTATCGFVRSLLPALPHRSQHAAW